MLSSKLKKDSHVAQMVSHLKVGKIEKRKTKHDNTCDWAELGSRVALPVQET